MLNTKSELHEWRGSINNIYISKNVIIVEILKPAIMRNLLALALLLVCSTSRAQDTTCVMITLDEVINFNYYTSEVIDRHPLTFSHTIEVKEGEVLCLHLFDDKRRFRDITLHFEDGYHLHEVFKSKDNVLYSKLLDEKLIIEIGTTRKRKKSTHD